MKKYNKIGLAAFILSVCGVLPVIGITTSLISILFCIRCRFHIAQMTKSRYNFSKMAMLIGSIFYFIHNFLFGSGCLFANADYYNSEVDYSLIMAISISFVIVCIYMFVPKLAVIGEKIVLLLTFLVILYMGDFFFWNLSELSTKVF